MDKRLRSWLFVPGNSEKMMGKVPSLDAEAVILDLQDAVPEAEKDAARGLVGRLVEDDPRRSNVYVRVNTFSRGIGQRDLAVVVKPGLAGVVLPLTAEPQQLEELDALLSEAETAEGMEDGAVTVLPQVESPLGVLNSLSLARHRRVIGLAFGGEDYALSLGTERSVEGTELLFARSMLANAAAAAGVQAIDTVYRDFRDDEGLAAECRAVRRLGFTGKLAIHPGQLATIHRAFRPTSGEIDHARRVVAAFEEAGGGIVTVDEQMVDAPVVERARRVLALAEEETS